MSSKPPHQDLGVKKERAILALIGEPTLKKAAEASNINERTLRRWLDDPEFYRAFSKARRQWFTQGLGLANYYTAMSVQTLAKTQQDPTAPHASKVAAAQAMLKFARDGIENEDLAQRVAALEASKEKKP